jgi:23S rRNA (uracil1939-C5)-methyltransferase
MRGDRARTLRAGGAAAGWESWQDRKLAVDVELVLADQGVAWASGLVADSLARTEALLDFARDNGLARLTLDAGYGPETTWEPDPPRLRWAARRWPCLRAPSFRRPPMGRTRWSRPRGWLAGVPTVADLFSGLGTLPLRWQAHRRTARPPRFWPWRPRDSHLACQAAARMNGRPVHALHRDLFRNPLRAEELNRFAAVLIDPPRAGAREQVAQIAESTVARVVYISCNPASWARDAATMVAAGYRLAGLKAVGQFRWSTHVELASLFVRETAA